MNKRDSKAMLVLCLLILAACQVILNALTPYLADDYVYMYSFLTKQRLSSLSDVAASMRTHSLHMNGRVIPHTMEQLFLMAPKLWFNLCNAGVYTLLIYLLYRVANGGERRSWPLFVAIAAGFWYVTPAYGQVALWQVGALNYLWGLAAGLVFLLPYLRLWLTGRASMPKLWQKILFILGSVLVGMYTEITSFIVTLLAVILLVLMVARKRQGLKCWLWLPIGGACLGYGILLSIPAEMAAKQGALTMTALLQRFMTATDMLKAELLPCFLVWAGLFGLGLVLYGPSRRVALSGVLAFGAVCANYMTIAAAYYPQRCMCTSAMLLVLACAVLLPELAKTAVSRGICRVGGGILAVLVALSVVYGVQDIWQTHVSYQQRVEVIQQSAGKEGSDLSFACIYPATKYSALWGTKDLDTEDPNTWPNWAISKYYGIDSIIGE